MKLSQRFLLGLKRRLDRVNDVAPTAIVDRQAWVSGATLGPHVKIAEGCKIYRAVVSGSAEIGRFTSLWGPDIYLAAAIHGIRIGSFCSIAHHVAMHESFHNARRTTTYFMEKNLFGDIHPPDAEISRGPITVGHDVWIGTGSIILSGVSVGNGAIIGAGSVVTRDVPPYGIVAGNPARFIRARFRPEVIAQLQDSEWWTWSVDRLRAEADFLTRMHEQGDRP